MYIYVCVGHTGNERDRNKASHGAAHDPYRIANYTFNPVLWMTLNAAAKKTLAREAPCVMRIRGMELAKRRYLYRFRGPKTRLHPRSELHCYKYVVQLEILICVYGVCLEPWYEASRRVGLPL